MDELRKADEEERDVEPVVRCCNCKYHRVHCTEGHVCVSLYGLRVISWNSFCPYGEQNLDLKRRSENEQHT